ARSPVPGKAERRRPAIKQKGFHQIPPAHPSLFPEAPNAINTCNRSGEPAFIAREARGTECQAGEQIAAESARVRQVTETPQTARQEQRLPIRDARIEEDEGMCGKEDRRKPACSPVLRHLQRERMQTRDRECG